MCGQVDQVESRGEFMSLSYEEEEAFLDLSQRHRDVVRALRRCRAAWQARQYAAVGGFLLGPPLVVSGLLWWWGLSIFGATLTVLSCLALVVHFGRRRRMKPDRRSPESRKAWRGLMG
jgi:hypothetical protein